MKGAKYVSIVAMFTAFISICGIVAHTMPWISHPTIGAILITFLYSTAFSVIGKLGTTTNIGLLVGVVNSFVFGLLLSIPVHLVRGATFNLFLLITRHRLRCKKHAITSSMLSFYLTMIVIYALLIPRFISCFSWLIMVGVPSVLLTILGGLLTLRYKEKFQQLWRAMR